MLKLRAPNEIQTNWIESSSYSTLLSSGKSRKTTKTQMSLLRLLPACLVK